jgi:hypothetical protein
MFYAFACDTKQEPLSEQKVDRHKCDLFELINYFNSQLNDILSTSIEVLKMMINLTI